MGDGVDIFEQGSEERQSMRWTRHVRLMTTVSMVLRTSVHLGQTALVTYALQRKKPAFRAVLATILMTQQDAEIVRQLLGWLVFGRVGKLLGPEYRAAAHFRAISGQC